MSEEINIHIPVLLNEVIESLCLPKKSRFLDCTFGGGGHSGAILEKCSQSVVYAIDRDFDAILRAESLKQKFGQRVFFYSMNFSNIANLCLPPLDGILMDLGVSSFQLDSKRRGFSFKYHAPLDMRMDITSGMTASQFLNTATEQQLIHAVRDLGEEKNWKKVIHAILNNRGSDKLLYSDSFADLVSRSIGTFGHARINPATKTFQGIRIAINSELEALAQALPLLFEKLAIGGRLAVISFHSLEDRIVKQFFKKVAGRAVDNRDFEPTQYKEELAKILTNKPIVPNSEEISANPRSRSAKLRILERIR